jgi:hypothetical protein
MILNDALDDAEREVEALVAEEEGEELEYGAMDFRR